MLLTHLGKRPRVDESAYVAPTATICGDVSIGAHSRILFGAVIVAEGGPVEIGEQCIIMEHAVIRGTTPHPTRIGDCVLVGPHAHLTGCTVEDEVFLATGVSVFNGARIGARTQVRINGVVHLKTMVPAGTLVPIGWVAIGDPAQILPPGGHESIAAIQGPLEFSRTVFGMERASAGESDMPELTRRYAKALGRHREDKVVGAQERGRDGKN